VIFDGFLSLRQADFPAKQRSSCHLINPTKAVVNPSLRDGTIKIPAQGRQSNRPIMIHSREDRPAGIKSGKDRLLMDSIQYGKCFDNLGFF
jgi:hypothetical protein